MSIHLISFAAGDAYDAAKKQMIIAAYRMKAFDTIKVYNYAELGPEFTQRHCEFIEQNHKGFGYWIWKPYIMWRRLNELPLGDIVVYLDICTSITNGHVEDYRFEDYIRRLKGSESKNLFFRMTSRVREFCKKDTMIYMDALHLADCYEYVPGILLSMVTAENCELYRQWYETICASYYLIDDSPSVADNFADFQVHRHDQSIFSILVNKTLRGRIAEGDYEELEMLGRAIYVRGNNYVSANNCLDVPKYKYW